MSTSGISGNGQVAQSGGQGYYYARAGSALLGNNISLAYPATITFNVTSGISSSGKATVSFVYNDGYGSITYRIPPDQFT